MPFRLTSLLILIILVTTACSPGRARRVSPRKVKTTDEIALVSVPKRVPPTIVIDPGHGGKDLGALSTTDPKYQEKTLNLNTAQYLDTFLQKISSEV